MLIISNVITFVCIVFQQGISRINLMYILSSEKYNFFENLLSKKKTKPNLLKNRVFVRQELTIILHPFKFYRINILHFCYLVVDF